MPHLVRGRVSTATGIAMVNLALIVAWLVPHAASVIAMVFLGTHLYSLLAGTRQWWTRAPAG